jgi:hypothetical protein
VAVAHKTGEITRIQHDAAIVYAERPFVLVVLVRGLDDSKKGATLAADIARVLYAASQRHSAEGRVGQTTAYRFLAASSASRRRLFSSSVASPT